MIVAILIMSSSVMADHDPFKYEDWYDQMAYDMSHSSTNDSENNVILAPTDGCTSLGQDLGNC